MLTSTDINICFNLDSGGFICTDVTDYSAQSVALVDITGVITVTAPSGVTYPGGSPDIDGSVGRINTTTIPIPTMVGGTPEVGTYRFDYVVTDGVNTVSTYKTFNFSFSSPTVTISPTVDCISPLLKSEDTTNYSSGSTTPSNQFAIVAADSALNTFTIAGVKSGLLTVGDTFNIISSTANDGEYTVTGVSFDGTNTVISVANVADNTADGLLATKTNKIFFPSVLQLSPLVGYGTIVSTSTFYTNNQEFRVDTRSFYDFGGGITLTDVTYGTNDVDVDCDTRLCNVYCCIDATLKAYLGYRGVNDTLAQRELSKYTVATSLLSQLQNAITCGVDSDVNTLTQEILKVTQCNTACSCEGDDPQPVMGLGAQDITVVDTTGNGIEVSSVTVGNTTTYTLALSQSILDAITAASATSSVVSTDGSITVTSSTALGNTQYDLSYTPAVSIAPKEMMSFTLNINYNQTTGVRSYAVSNVVIQNQSNLSSPSTITDLNAANPSFLPFYLRLTDFQSVPNSTFKYDFNVVNWTYFNSVGFIPAAGSSIWNNLTISALGLSNDTGALDLGFVLNTGSTVVGRDFLNRYTNIELNVKIYE